MTPCGTSRIVKPCLGGSTTLSKIRTGPSFGGLHARLLSLLLAAPLAALASQGEATAPSAESSEGLQLEGRLVAYRDFPFPEVAPGELWRPDLSFSEITTFVPSGTVADFPQAARDLLERSKAMVAAGDGKGAIELLTQHLDQVPEGAAQRAIGEIHLAGSGGVVADDATGRAWIERAARLNPQLYDWLGRTEPDPRTRVHVLSVGLSRGCLACANSLVFAYDSKAPANPRKRKDQPAGPQYLVPPDLRLAYALVATDMGAEAGPVLLSRVLNDQRSQPHDLPAWASQLSAELNRDVKTVLGDAERVSNIGILPGVVYTKLHTGLVPGRLGTAAEHIEAGRWTQAAKTLVFTDARGRYLPRAINLLMTRAPDDPKVIGGPAVMTLALRAAEWGDLDHAAAAALIHKHGYKRMVWRGKRWQTLGEVNNLAAATYLAAGEHAGLMPTEVLQLISSVQGKASATESAARARQCLASASRSRESTLQTWLNCRTDTYRAWAGTNEVDFGVLSDQFFAQLAQTAADNYQSEYNRRVSGAADRIAANELARARPGIDLSNTRVTAIGDMQRRNEAFARANPQNFRNMPSHYKQVEEWRSAFVRQRSRVASGTARDLRDDVAPSGRAESCGVWSLRLMPFCN